MSPRHDRTLSAVALMILPILMQCGGSKTSPLDPNAVAYSFVTVGCNRVDKGDWAPGNGNPSSANSVQLLQTYTDASAIAPPPNTFFFTGDMTLGYVNDDGTVLKGQLDGWANLYKNHQLAAKTVMVPVPGNHEVLYKDSTGTGFAPAMHPIWRTWLASNSFDRYAGNGPTSAAPNVDNLMDDQSKFTYSFNVGNIHFVCVNTDTWTSAYTIGSLAMNWITQDIQAAQANAAVGHIFVFGHKPIQQATGSISSDGTIAAAFQTPMTTLLRSNNKVKAYFCAHAHQYDATPLGGAGGPLQVVTGNGGSKLETYWTPATGTYFGFTLVRVYRSGRVSYTPFSRPVPSPSYLGVTVPATAQTEVDLVR